MSQPHRRSPSLLQRPPSLWPCPTAVTATKPIAGYNVCWQHTTCPTKCLLRTTACCNCKKAGKQFSGGQDCGSIKDSMQNRLPAQARRIRHDTAIAERYPPVLLLRQTAMCSGSCVQEKLRFAQSRKVPKYLANSSFEHSWDCYYLGRAFSQGGAPLHSWGATADPSSGPQATSAPAAHNSQTLRRPSAGAV